MEFFVVGVVALILFIFAMSAIKIVRPYQRGVIERLVSYVRTTGSGLTMIMPFVESISKVDMREQVVDVPPQEVITKDNVVVTVDAVVYYEATDPVKLRYNVANFYMAATKLAQTNLRNVIGDMNLDESLTSRDTINLKLREVLDDATDKWGVRIVRVEIQRIDPPADVTQAMHQQMKAERERRAKVLDADGDREASIRRAEGEKQAAILSAEGEAAAIQKVADASRYKLLTEAKGEAEAITNVYNAIHEGRPTNDLIAIKYLEAIQKVADGRATKIFLPLETSGVLGSLAGIGELFKKDTAAQAEGPATAG